MDSFDQATCLVRLGPNLFRWSVPDGWQQGRGAWGGLVVGAMVRAVALAGGDDARRVRTVSAQLAAPALDGPHEIVVAQDRRGSSMSTWSARLIDAEGRLVACLAAILGSARAVDAELGEAAWGTVVIPQAPPADEVPLIAFGPPKGPVFGQHVRARPISGWPVSGRHASTLGWIGYAETTAVDEGSLLALVDAWWPASLVALTAIRAVVTVNFAANILVDPASVPAGEQLLHEAFVSAASQGFMSEQRRLWTPDGRLVVDNLQSMVIVA